jgi:hypothetical protein
LCTLLSTTVGHKFLTQPKQTGVGLSTYIQNILLRAVVLYSAKEGFAPETADADKASSAAQRLLEFIGICIVRPPSCLNP